MPAIISLKRMADEERGIDVPAHAVQRSREMLKQRLQSIQLAYKKGVKITAGTDGGTPKNPHEDLVKELALLKRECMSAEETLMGATNLAAQGLGIAEEVGILEEGKIADLVIMNRNALKGITALRIFLSL